MEFFPETKGSPLIIWFAAHIPANSSGGVNRSISEFSKNLKIFGHATKIIYKKQHENLFFFSIKIAFHLCFSFKNPPDWIIARSTDGLFCSILCKLLNFKTKTALHSHGWEEKVYELEKLIPGKLVNNPTTCKARFLRFPLLRLNLNLSSLCLTGTVEEARWIKGRYPSAKNKIKLITNGTDLQVGPYWAHKTFLPYNFLIVGGYTWKKNIQYGINLFINIHKSLPQSRLFLIGTGKSDSFYRYINSFKDSVTVIEEEPLESMHKWYVTCPFLISTSRYEGGYSLAILEALSRGAIVFSTSIPSTREFITDFSNGILLTGTDEQSDAQKIMRVIHEDNLIRKISINAWKKASRYSWKRQSLRLEKLLLNY